MISFEGPIASVSGITATTSVTVTAVGRKTNATMFDMGWFTVVPTGNSGTSPAWDANVIAILGGVTQPYWGRTNITGTAGLTMLTMVNIAAGASAILKGIPLPKRVDFVLSGGTASGNGFSATVFACLFSPK